MSERSRVDMGPDAIDARLREMSQLHRLGLSFRDARRVGRVNPKEDGADARTGRRSSARTPDR